MFRFEKLKIWEEAINYGNEIFNLTKTFPKETRFDFTSQLRRAALSISNNIAEGSGCTTNKEFRRFLDISIKSALETISSLYLAKKQDYINENTRLKLYKKAEILIKQIHAFKKSLK